MDSRVASRYARALFASAKEQGIVTSIQTDLEGVCAVLDHSGELRNFIGNPSTARQDRLSMYDKLFSDRTTALTMSLLRLLVDKNREMYIHDIREEFDRIRREEGNVLKVIVESAKELNPDDKKAITEKLAKATGKAIDPEYIIVPELMLGVRVTYNNQVIDSTARGAIDRLRDRLVNDVLKQV